MIERMHKATLSISQVHLNVLKRIVPQLEGAGILWAVTGSNGFALQGMPVTVHDIDLQTDEAGAYAIEQLFARFVTRPVSFSATSTIRSHFGALNIDGIVVEIMGDIQKRAGDSAWEEPVNLSAHRRFIVVAGMRIPVLSLAYERDAYLKLGRQETAAMLANWLEKTSPAGKL